MRVTGGRWAVGTQKQRDGGRPSWLWAAFVAVFLAVPLFAHGCHGDDVDHEPAAEARQERQ